MTLLYSMDLSTPPIGQYNEPTNMLVSSTAGTLGSTVIREVNTNLGEKSLMFKVISDGTIDVYRSELSGDGAGRNAANENILGRIQDGTELYVGFKVFLPLGMEVGNDTSLFQMHYDNVVSGSPPFLLEASKDGNFKVNHRFNTVLNADRTTDITAANTRRAPIEFGRWINFVFHLQTSNTASGKSEVWKDSRLIYSNNSVPNNYNIHRNPPTDTSLARNYFKFGLYCFEWKTNPPITGTTMTAYYKDIKVGTTKADVE